MNHSHNRSIDQKQLTSTTLMGIMSPAEVWYPATAEDADDAAKDDGHIPPPIRFADDSKSWWLAAVGGWNRAATAEDTALGAALLVAEAADLRARMPAVRESMVAGSFVLSLASLAKAPEVQKFLPDRRAGFSGNPRKLAREQPKTDRAVPT